MKTHDLSKALTQLGKILRSLPNQELSDLMWGFNSSPTRNKPDIGISLSVLASLSKYGKADWEEVIREFNLPVEIRPRDASRDIMGKILNYLAENDKERERIAAGSGANKGTSSELTNALKFLLSNE